MRYKLPVLPGVSFAWAIIATLAGCAKDAPETQRVVLPGFSVELPPGDVISTSSAPTGGKHSIKLPAPSWSDSFNGVERAEQELEVHWTTNVLSHEMWSAQYIPAIASQLPSAGANAKVLEERTVAGDRWLYVVGNESTPVGIGVVNCDPHFSIIVSYVRFTDRARQATSLSRIIESVRCAVADANRARPEASTRLPAKFGREKDPSGQFYRSLDGERLGINIGSGDVQRDPAVLRDLIRAVVNGTMRVQTGDWQYLQNPTPANNASILRSTISESGVNVYFGVRYCAPSNLSTITFWISPNANDAAARERFSQIGCPGEASTPSPDFATLAEAACVAGDQAACDLSPTLP